MKKSIQKIKVEKFRKTSVYGDASLIKMEQIANSNLLKLKPNPANDYVIVQWILPETVKDPYLYISNIDGHFIEKIKINGLQNSRYPKVSNLGSLVY